MNEALGALKYCLSWSPQWKRWSGITPFPSVFTFKKDPYRIDFCVLILSKLLELKMSVKDITWLLFQ